LINRVRRRGLIFDVDETPFECEYCGLPLVGLRVVDARSGEPRDLIPFLCPRCASAADLARALKMLKRYARSENEYLYLFVELCVRADRAAVLQFLVN